MDLELPEELRLMQSSVRKFVDEMLAPHEKEVEETGRVNASFWNVVGATSGLCGTAIEIGGPDAVRERYLPDLFTGKKVGAYALSEPGPRSDAGRLKTHAKRDGDDYV